MNRALNTTMNVSIRFHWPVINGKVCSWCPPPHMRTPAGGGRRRDGHWLAGRCGRLATLHRERYKQSALGNIWNNYYHATPCSKETSVHLKLTMIKSHRVHWNVVMHSSMTSVFYSAKGEKVEWTLEKRSHFLSIELYDKKNIHGHFQSESFS